MQSILDFLTAALPWIAIGLFIAVTITSLNMKAKGESPTKLFTRIKWFPVGAFFLMAILDYIDGDRSGGTTWLILGIANYVINSPISEKR